MEKLSHIERMGTEVRGVRYDVARRAGQLHMPDGCRCDMQACIDLFEGIDSHVEIVFTYAGARAGMIYSRDNGKWSAIRWKTSVQSTASRPVSAKSKT